MFKPFIIVGDAGHGGKDSGAVNPNTGEKEKDIVLLEAQLTKIELERYGVLMLLTRDSDIFLELSDRSRFANLHDAPFISFHCNAYNTKARGVEGFTSRGTTGSDRLATMLLKAVEPIANKYGIPLRYDMSDGDIDKEANFSVLRNTRNEAFLAELGFIDNDEDLVYLLDSVARKERVEARALAIVQWAESEKGFKRKQHIDKPLPPVGATIEERLSALEAKVFNK
jgi:N-acetylmuramoyl-L-alanine amidase